MCTITLSPEFKGLGNFLRIAMVRLMTLEFKYPQTHGPYVVIRFKIRPDSAGLPNTEYWINRRLTKRFELRDRCLHIQICIYYKIRRCILYNIRNVNYFLD